MTLDALKGKYMISYKNFHRSICDYALDLYNEYKNDELLEKELREQISILFSLSSIDETHRMLGAESMSCLAQMHSCFLDNADRSEVYASLSEILIEDYCHYLDELVELHEADESNDRFTFKRILEELFHEFDVHSLTDVCCPSCGFTELAENHGFQGNLLWTSREDSEFDLLGNLVGSVFVYFHLSRTMMRVVLDKFVDYGFETTIDEDSMAIVLSKAEVRA